LGPYNKLSESHSIPNRMELREFAHQILFGTTLAEKLAAPGLITDERPGPALAGPPAPGRSANLQFKPHAAGKSEFPGLHRLEDTAERGKLLHFFANHELLATELMALVLLKFPDAPAAFRKGVFQTLQDEQEHTRLYIERMKSCGIQLGDLPVSGYFWRCVAPMEHPIDYVAGLCLTFEQANLDFAGHYGRSFNQVGDGDSARLLEKIYRDEIGHVAYGLKWFRRWKNPAQSDWDAFCQTLKFPLSPQRAKGFALNIAGRRAAGLDPAFIAELNVYSQSKGRTPSVFVFNPFAEGLLAEGKAFNPAKHQAQLARDLENLPQFLCRQDDIVLTSRKPSVEFLSSIKQAGFPLPEFMEFDWRAGLRPGAFPDKVSSKPVAHDPNEPTVLSLSDAETASPSPAGAGEGWGENSPKDSRIAPPNHPACRSGKTLRAILPLPGGEGWGEGGLPSFPPSEVHGESARASRKSGSQFSALSERKLGSLRPWAWGPDSFELLKPIFPNVSGEKRADDQRFNDRIARLYSKSWSADFLRHLLGGEAGNRETGRQNPPPSPIDAAKQWLCTENEIGAPVRSMDEALAAISAIRSRGHHRVVLKQSFGVAGGNALRLFEPEILGTQLRWMQRNFERRQELVVEPWLERVRDFSVQLEMTGQGLKLCGYTGLITDERGQFAANFAEPHHHQRIPSRVIACFEQSGNISGVLLEFYECLFMRLEQELRAAEFVGPIGIDAFVYRHADGRTRLKPVVEINPRHTMGRVLVELMRHVCQNSAGVFRLVNAAQLRAAGFENFPALARALAAGQPLQFEGDPIPRIRQGALCLNDPALAKSCLAVFHVGRIVEALLENPISSG
jgi:uncharacterized ferritin-like protein (DUF455 family)